MLPATAEGAAVKLLQHKNETTSDMHHITVIIQDSGEQFSSDLCGTASVVAPWLGPDTLRSPLIQRGTLLSSPRPFEYMRDKLS